MKETLTNIYDILCFMEMFKQYPVQMESLHLAITSEDWDATNNVLRELKRLIVKF